jgi:isopenicillin-N epimerase
LNDLDKDWAEHWAFRRKFHFNHGSFGATPIKILERQAAMMAAFNAEREDWLWGTADTTSMLKLVPQAVNPLAEFVGADPADLVYVDNVTDAFSSVIRSLSLGTGDQVLVTNHIYANFPPPLKDLARWQGFEIVIAQIPYPVESDGQIVAAIMGKVTSRTKLAIIDHISSPSAIIFPVKNIVAALKEKNVDTFVDGAHGPGQVSVDVGDLGAAYYAANNHKWLCAPVGSGFLHVRRDRQAEIMPAVGSGAAHPDAPFAERFVWRGTKDMSAHLMVPETIEYLAALHPQGWEGIRCRNHELAVAARNILADALGVEKPCPDEMIGAMFTLPLGKLNFPPELMAEWPVNRLRSVMIARYGYGVTTVEFEGQYLLRVTAHLYNNVGQYRELAAALEPVLEGFER